MTSALESALERSLDSSRWRLILLPTERCNFRCTYCYETFANGVMTARVVSAVKNLISRRIGELAEFSIDWFGGEPLLARHVIREISGHVLEQRHPDLSYHAGMTTNGYLLDRGCLEELNALGVTSFQVSLDGWGEAHNASRKHLRKEETFDTIWANLLAAQESSLSFDMVLRVHFSPTSLGSVRTLLRKIGDAFGSDPRFRVFLKAVSRLGGPNDQELEVFQGVQRREVVRELRKWVRMTSRPATAENAVYVCYASQPNSLVIRSTGKIAKCTVALESPENEVGSLLDDGTISLNDERLTPWFVGLGTQELEALACPWEVIRRSGDQVV